MRYRGLKASAQTISCHLADCAFIWVVLSTFACIWRYLQRKLLYDTLNALLVDKKASLTEQPPNAPITEVFMLGTDFKYLLLQRLIFRFSIQSLLPVHIGCFWQICNSKDVLQSVISSETVDNPCCLFCASSAKRNLLASLKKAFSIRRCRFSS